MSLLPNLGSIGSGVSNFYSGAATQSVRFPVGETHLQRTPGTSGNQKKWTSSFWVKRTKLGTGYLWSGASYSGNDGIAAIYFDSDQLHTYYDGSSAPYGAIGPDLYRDVNAWYHIVWAVDAANAVHRIWVNGVLRSTNTNNYPENFAWGMNRANTLNKFGEAAWGNSAQFEGYLADFYHLDGQYLDYTSFAEFKNGVLIPKVTSGLTFGTNGFHLEFKQNSVGSGAADTIGADTSGEDNHLDSAIIAADDCNMPDSPENNFATMNQSYVTNSNTTLSDGNLKQTSAAAWLLATSTIGFSSGKWYAELKMIDVTNFSFGIVAASGDSVANGNTANSGYVGKYADGYGWWGNGASAQTINNNSNVNYGANPSADDIFMLAVDMDNGDVFMGKEGTWFNSGNPANGTNPAFNNQAQLQDGSTWLIAGGFENANGYWNFGQNSVFDDESAGGNADGNGIGDFAYAPPSGYLALCTVNLPEPTISPNSDTQATDYFNTVLYTGNGSGQTITGVGFQPDWTWNKNRATTDFNILQDSTRGAGKELFSNSSADEESYSTSITSWNSDGFVLGDREPINANNEAYVSWNWKANGGTTTTNDASSTSVGTIDSVFQANTTAGFSIVTFAADNTAGRVVAHGLGVAPKMIITKGIAQATGWYTYHFNIGANKFIRLNEANPEATNTGIWGNTHPTSSVFTIGNNECGYNNGGANDVLAYCFAEVDGYSKMGSYVGNVDAEGVYVYLGFRPAWILLKRTTGGSTYNWFIHDNKRGASNVNKERLTSDTNEAEATGITSMDFLSNGFKIRTANTSYNEGNFIYMAFAAQPFKYSLGG